MGWNRPDSTATRDYQSCVPKQRLDESLFYDKFSDIDTISNISNNDANQQELSTLYNSRS